MRAKRLDSDGVRVYALVFDMGEEALEGLRRFARDEGMEAARFSGIGALQDVVLGYWDWERKDYERISIREQVEVLILSGNIASSPEGGLTVHGHLVIGKRDGTAHGGHLLEAHVRPTLEIMVTETAEPMQRRKDDRTGLALLDV